MTIHTLIRRRRLTIVALFGVLALAVLPAPAFAHAHLKSTSPAANATLAAAPRELVLMFSEAPTLAMSALRLIGPDAQTVALGALAHGSGANTLTASIDGPMSAGKYTVEWQTAGDDGHVQHGSFGFVIAEGAQGLAAAMPPGMHGDSARVPDVSILDSAVAPTTPAGMGVSSPVYVVIRWVQFVALLLVIGAVAFRWWVLPRAGIALDEAPRLALASGAAIAGLRGAWLLLITALARLAAQRATMRAVPGASSAPGVGPMLLHTAWGHGWIIEVIALVVLVAVLLPARRDAASVNAWRIAAAAAAALAFVPGLSGHAIADRSYSPWTLLFDGAHVLSAGAWLGTLAVLLVVGLPVASRAAASSREAVALMLDAFSPVALTCAGLLVFSGVVAARVHVASWAAFTTTSYGRVLLVKLAVVVLLIAVAAYNWRRAKPALRTVGPGPLARSGRAEVTLAVLVLLVTAVLVALPTPAELVR